MGEHRHSSSKHKKQNDNDRDGHRGGPSEIEDSFQARPTNRLGKDHKIQADGDTWQEMMAVCEAPEKDKEDGDSKLVIRSYYQNSRTQERVWDEPPSGATKIVPASEEVRRMAQLQLNELHVVKKGKKKTEKKKTLMGRIFGTNKNKEKKSKRGRIEYKPGSQMYAGRAEQDTEDAMMQEAIAASIAESKGEAYVRPQQEQSLDDEMAMAQALSMSAAEQDAEENALAHALSLSAAEHENAHLQGQEPTQIHPTQSEEDEILARVMEQSKLETKRGEGNFIDVSGYSNVAPNNPFDAPLSPDDRKPPAFGRRELDDDQMYHSIERQLQDLQLPSMAPDSAAYARAPVGAMPPGAASASNPSAHYAASSNAAAAASASQYAAAMAAASSAPNMKAPPSYAMAPANSTSPPPSNYPSHSPTAPNMIQGNYGGGGGPAALSPTNYPAQPTRMPVIAPSIPNPAIKKPPPPPPALAPDANPFSTTAPILNSRSSTAASAMFDPYSKDAKPSASAAGATSYNHKPSESSEDHDLLKMSAEPRKMSNLFKRKSASAKVQDKAGLV